MLPPPRCHMLKEEVVALKVVELHGGGVLRQEVTVPELQGIMGDSSLLSGCEKIRSSMCLPHTQSSGADTHGQVKSFSQDFATEKHTLLLLLTSLQQYL